jgi:dephospho-CoA kinase
MRQKHGLGFWAKRAVETMQPDRDYVIDSIRNPGEIRALADSGDFVLFSVEAPLETRFTRVLQRPERDEKEAMTLVDFKKSEARETGSGQSHNQQLDKCAKLAQVSITNDRDMATFFAKIDKELAGYSGKARHFEI